MFVSLIDFDEVAAQVICKQYYGTTMVNCDVW
jgi:hypothetical protein